jgi:transcriptional regulator with XRE-family HTH domain
MKPYVPDVAALISAAESADLSRVEIARRSGLSPASITRLANGERGVRPSADTVFKLQGVVAGLTIVKK